MPSIRSSKISVIENGTKLYKHIDRDFKKKKFNILILGSLTFKKGIDLFIEVLPAISNRINQVRIVGSGAEEIKLINLTKKLSLDSIIKFIPFTSDPSIHIYESDIGLIPSRWEGFGLVAAESMALGVPVVSSNMGELNNLVSNGGGTVVEARKFKEFKESIEEYLENHNKAKLAKKRGQEYVAKNLSIHSRVEVLTNIYKGL